VNRLKLFGDMLRIPSDAPEQDMGSAGSARDLLSLARNLLEAYQPNGPLQADIWLVSISGGLDSMVMLRILDRLGREFGIRVVAAHCCHALRGKESERDARHCSEICSELDIECHLLDCELGKGAALQERARNLRKDSLLDLASGLSCTEAKSGTALSPSSVVWIATAHHLDDQAETVLFRLLRGTGPAGLKGISMVDKPYFRPLMTMTRSEIGNWAKQQGVSWVEDSSNESLDYTRNRLRCTLLPECRKIMGFDSKSAIGLMAMEMAGWESIVREWVHRFLAEGGGDFRQSVTGAGVFFLGDRRKFQSLSSDRLFIALSLILSETAINPSRAALIPLLGHFNGRDSKSADLPGGIMEFYPRKFFVGRCEDSPMAALKKAISDWKPPAGGRFMISEMGMKFSTPVMEIEILERVGLVEGESSGIDHFMDLVRKPSEFDGSFFPDFSGHSCDKNSLDVSENISLMPEFRLRSGGEYFCFLGREVSRPLKKEMMDSGLPRLVRDSIPLLFIGNMAVWIPGSRGWSLKIIFPGKSWTIKARTLGGWNGL
jgi:tRNA(Ile)-lysidine synthetase-like protein